MSWHYQRWLTGALALVGGLILTWGNAPWGQTAEVSPRVRETEAQRIAVINQVRPSVVAVFGAGGQGGGSGVLIDAEGYALTNFHVVAGSGPVMKCGLPDGILYDAVLVGLDKVGDVALIKLLPKKVGTPFPFAKMGDSDQVRVGDWSLAMGNPFLLATDFTPSVSFGLISGVNRYQYPEGGLLEYTDCIQFDTTINPGNSGGPLFNMQGELIGINGRGSFAQDKRFRINSGVGYAISINQIKNFLGHLRAGIDTDHATLGAAVDMQGDDADLSAVVVKVVLEESDAARRGIEEGDELIAFAGRPISSVNQFKNILGIFPKEWRVPVTIRKKSERKEVLVRLAPYLPSVQRQPMNPGGPRPVPPTPKVDSPASKLFKEKKGFANYYFNELQQQKLLAGFAKWGDFSTLTGDWIVDGEFVSENRSGPMKLHIKNFTAADSKETRTIVQMKLNVDYELEPLKPDQSDADLMEPANSGGLLMAMYHYRRLLTSGPKGFELGFSHGGTEPFYPFPVDGSQPKSLKDLRIDTDVLRTEHAAVQGKWYFSQKDQRLLGFEITVAKETDPCEVYLHDYRPIGEGRQLPFLIEVRHGDKRYTLLKIKSYQLAAAK